MIEMELGDGVPRLLYNELMECAKQKGVNLKWLCDLYRRGLREGREASEGVLSMAVHRLEGMVEGRPTERVNFLQRIDELREMERRLAQVTEEKGQLQHRAEQAETIAGDSKWQNERLVARCRELEAQVEKSERRWRDIGGLSPEASRQVLELLDNPPEPNEALMRALQRCEPSSLPPRGGK